MLSHQAVCVPAILLGRAFNGAIEHHREAWLICVLVQIDLALIMT